MNANGFTNRFHESNIPNTEPQQNPLKAGALTFKTPKTEFSGVIFVKLYPFVVQKCPVAYLFTIFYILNKQDFTFLTYFIGFLHVIGMNKRLHFIHSFIQNQGFGFMILYSKSKLGNIASLQIQTFGIMNKTMFCLSVFSFANPNVKKS
jgi:hypothetical protein